MSLGPEDRLHTWLRRRLRHQGFDRLGDDGAILPAGGPWAVTQDHQIEAVHFPPDLDPRLIARRLLAVNLSDLAAMGAQPDFAFLALSFPPQFEARRFLDSFITACGRFDLELAGGDLARNDRLTAALTLLGSLPARGKWVTRDNSRPGDRLWLAGTLGLSALGRHLLESGARIEGRRVVLPVLQGISQAETRLGKRAVRCHLVPRPRLDVGEWLGTRPRAAAIDISDGFAIDLRRLTRESAVGARVWSESLPWPRGFTSLCERLDISSLDLVLGGGEDYALLFSVSSEVSPPSALDCVQIGEIRSGSAIQIRRGSRLQPLPEGGWDHFTTPERDPASRA